MSALRRSDSKRLVAVAVGHRTDRLIGEPTDQLPPRRAFGDLTPLAVGFDGAQKP